MIPAAGRAVPWHLRTPPAATPVAVPMPAARSSAPTGPPPRPGPATRQRVGWISDSGNPPPAWLAEPLAAQAVQLLAWRLEPGPVPPVAGLLLWLDQSPEAALPLVRALRQQGPGALLVLSGPCAPAVLQQTVQAGADLHLLRPLSAAHVLAGLQMLWQQRPPAQTAEPPWTLLEPSGLLLGPGGELLALDAAEHALLRELGTQPGWQVGASQLAAAAGCEAEHAQALLYRLRRRAERETGGRHLLSRSAAGAWSLTEALVLRPD